MDNDYTIAPKDLAAVLKTVAESHTKAAAAGGRKYVYLNQVTGELNALTVEKSNVRETGYALLSLAEISTLADKAIKTANTKELRDIDTSLETLKKSNYQNIQIQDLTRRRKEENSIIFKIIQFIDLFLFKSTTGFFTKKINKVLDDNFLQQQNVQVGQVQRKLWDRIAINEMHKALPKMIDEARSQEREKELHQGLQGRFTGECELPPPGIEETSIMVRDAPRGLHFEGHDGNVTVRMEARNKNRYAHITNEKEHIRLEEGDKKQKVEEAQEQVKKVLRNKNDRKWKKALEAALSQTSYSALFADVMVNAAVEGTEIFNKLQLTDNCILTNTEGKMPKVEFTINRGKKGKITSIDLKITGSLDLAIKNETTHKVEVHNPNIITGTLNFRITLNKDGSPNIAKESIKRDLQLHL